MKILLYAVTAIIIGFLVLVVCLAISDFYIGNLKSNGGYVKATDIWEAQAVPWVVAALSAIGSFVGLLKSKGGDYE